MICVKRDRINIVDRNVWSLELIRSIIPQATAPEISIVGDKEGMPHTT